MDSQRKKLLDNPVIYLLLLAIVYFMLYFTANMVNDEGMWNYVAYQWVHNGQPPYLGAVENKTPAIYYLFTISYYFFGVNYWLPRLFGAISLLLCSYFIYRLGKKIANPFAGIASMLIFGLAIIWQDFDGAFLAQTETFMITFTLISIYTILSAFNTETKNRAFMVTASGFFMGIALAFKQIAILDILILFYVLFTYKNLDLKNLILLVGGGLLSTLLSFFPLYLSGITFADYVKGAWLILLNEGSSASILYHFSGFLRIFRYTDMIIFLPFLFYFLYHRKNIFLKYDYVNIILVWFFADFIGINASGFFFGHQIKQIIPVLALIAGITISDYLKKNKLTSKQPKIILLILLVCLPFNYFETVVRGFVKGVPEDNSKILGCWLKNNSSPKDYLYFIGGNGNPYLAYSERESSSRYFHSLFITNDRILNEVKRDLDEKPPKYIIIEQGSRKIAANFAQIINLHYKEVNKIDNYTVLKKIN